MTLCRMKYIGDLLDDNGLVYYNTSNDSKYVSDM